MTKSSISAADATKAEAGAPESEVTPEMIDAGLQTLYASGALDVFVEDLDREVIRKVYLAMKDVKHHALT